MTTLTANEVEEEGEEPRAARARELNVARRERVTLQGDSGHRHLGEPEDDVTAVARGCAQRPTNVRSAT